MNNRVIYLVEVFNDGDAHPTAEVAYFHKEYAEGYAKMRDANNQSASVVPVMLMGEDGETVADE